MAGRRPPDRVVVPAVEHRRRRRPRRLDRGGGRQRAGRGRHGLGLDQQENAEQCRHVSRPWEVHGLDTRPAKRLPMRGRVRQLTGAPEGRR